MRPVKGSACDTQYEHRGELVLAAVGCLWEDPGVVDQYVEAAMSALRAARSRPRP